MKEAMFYEKLAGKKVQCRLCPNNCIILPGKRGSCKVRENSGGTLVSLVYGRLVSTHIDPIEKKPLFHFLPGSKTYSISTVGCNFHCLFCQNWEISQSAPENVSYKEVKPSEVVDEAKLNSCKSISYTYVEPAIFFEFVLDCAKLAKKAGIKNVMVTNGFINPEPLKLLYKYIDAANIDIKGFTEQFYRKYCSGKLKPVLEAAKLMKKHGTHVETTTLIIPKINDNLKDIKKIMKWIKKELGKETPVHLSRFYPMFKMQDTEPTPEATLMKAYEIAKDAGLDYVYVGNLRNDKHEHTCCSKCGKKIIIRTPYFSVAEMHMKKNKCEFCGNIIPGVF